MADSNLIKNLEAILAGGQDNALLRFSLGAAYAKAKQYDPATKHLAEALKFDPEYSAAWKLYGKTLSQNGQNKTAIEAYKKGIQIARKKGDIQAAKEMQVFLNRLLQKQPDRPSIGT